LAAWGRQTAGPFDVRSFDGDHFYLFAQEDPVLDEIARTLNETTS
jgi:surfactin synthase thioesterase subunit